MERLWAPWRMEYIEQLGRDDEEGCIFCSKPREERDRENLLLYRTSHSFVIMNLFPYNNGHLLVVPRRHTADFLSLTPEELTDVNRLLQLSLRVLTEAVHPQGFNIGWNLGRVAGAGIADHLHCHLVPRWNGDTNFMPVLGRTKVISEELGRTWDKLHPLFVRLDAEATEGR